MNRRWARFAALLAAAVVVAPATPAFADPTPQLVVTGMQTVPGQVRFFLAARSFPER